MKSKHILAHLCFLFFSIGIVAQPINDSCHFAIYLPVDTICQADTFDNIGATKDDISTAPNPTCGFYKGGDIWFKLTVPSSGAIAFERTNISGNAQFAIYEGVCGSLTQVYCNQSDGQRTYVNPSMAGDTIYARFYKYNSVGAISFELCVFEPKVPPNNHCVNASYLPITPTCLADTLSNRFSTKESVTVAQNPSCGFYKGGDVWYKTVLGTKASLRAEVRRISGSNPQFAFYSGSCGNFQEIECAQLDKTKTIHKPSMVGDTIWLRVYGYNSKNGGEYTLCMWEPDMAINDYCPNALFLPTDTVCQPDTFTDRYATGDGLSVSPNPSCGFYKGGDVWFKTVMPTSGEIRIERTSLSGNQQFALFSGTCGSFQELTCSQLDNDRTFIDSSLIGDTLFLRVYGYNSDEGGEFTLCFWDPPVPPNNNCAGAEYLTLTDSCVNIARSNKYATGQGINIAPNPSCSFYKGGDVWFKTVMPTSGAIRWETDNNSVATTLYSGGCKSFQEELCKQLDDDATFLDSSLAGDTVFLRVFTYSSEEGRDFDLCLFEPEIPLNNNCQDALFLPIDSSYRAISNCESFTNQYATSQQGVAPNPSCGFFKGGDVWFKTVVPPNGRFILTTNNQMQSAVYKGGCGNFSEIACLQLDVNGVVYDTSSIGDTVFIRLFSYNSEEGKDFDLRLRSTYLPTNDNCADAIPLDSGISIFSNAGASRDSSGTGPNPNCGFMKGGDVWFTYNVPSSGFIKIKKYNLQAGINPQAQLYTGSCGSLVRYQCLQLSNSTIQVTDTSLSGQTIYIRIYNYNSPEGGSFAICAYDSTCPNVQTNSKNKYLCPCEAFIPDSNQILSTTNEYSELYKASDGTDSIVVYTFANAPIHEVFVSDSICDLSWFTFPDGDSILIDSFAIDTSVVLSQYGCDSTVITAVSTWPRNVNFESIQLCQGENFIKPDGDTIFNLQASLIDSTSLQNNKGCDSSIVTNISVNTVFTMQQKDSVCLGENYVFPDGDTAFSILTTTIDTSAFFSQFSCDSHVVTTVSVLTVYDTLIDVAICKGTNFTFPDGSLLNGIIQDTTQTSLLQSTMGCDSIVSTQLTVQSVDATVVLSGGNLEAVNQNADEYQWLNCDSNFAIVAGENSYQLTPRNANENFALAIRDGQCRDTSTCHFLLGVGIEKQSSQSTFTIYPNPVSDVLTINSNDNSVISTIAIFTYERVLVEELIVENTALTIDMSNLLTGVYLVQIVTKKDTFTVRIMKD